MPEGTVTFDVRVPVDRAWAFLSDMRKVGTCVPGVEAIEVIDDRRAKWTLKVKIGPLSQRIQVDTETIEQVPPSRARFRGVADNMEMLGTIELAPAGDATRIKYTMAATAKGPLARIIDNMMKSRLKQQSDEFAANVKKALEV
ncbi:MAG TPA: SRPBCC domain-containing protein [Thermoplasmata archaeon]|nr:SRPBCC domain-containing protein [Thermoplasmata archaeon]